jgi:deoxyribonuclease V
MINLILYGSAMNIKTACMCSFNATPGQAIRLQQRLQSNVIARGTPRRIRYAAGVDVGFKNGNARAAVAVLSMPDLHLCDCSVALRPIEFPYIPGLLSFREIPVILDALHKISITPDVIICDGQGIAHPRRMGIASHLGVLTGLRTIGAAKSRLTGTHGNVPVCKGQWIALRDKSETIGAVLCTRDNVRPLYISIGHRISLDSAIEIVMSCVTRYRLPETTRWAHRLAADGSAAVPKQLG